MQFEYTKSCSTAIVAAWDVTKYCSEAKNSKASSSSKTHQTQRQPSSQLVQLNEVGP